MKICHFISSRGLGQGEFYIDLVNELCKMEHEISLLIPKNSKYIHRIDPRILVIEYHSKDTRNNPFLLIEVYQKIKQLAPDIVHTHFAKSSEIFYLINKILKIPHIATKHNPRKGKIFNKLQHVTAVAKDVAKSISVPSKIIHNGLSPVQVTPTYRTNEKFTITAIGRLDKIKGFDILIKEMKKVKYDCILNIIGDGDEYQNLQNIIHEYNLEDRVNLLGFIKEIPSVMANSDLVLMSSHSEGFSLVLIESIFYANVFISTKVSGCKDVLSNDLLIDSFEIADKVNNVIENYDTFYHSFKKIKESNQDRFLLNTVAKQYIQYYRSVLTQTRK